MPSAQRWEPQPVPARRLEGFVRIIARDYVGPIADLARSLASAIPGVKEGADAIEKVAARFAADLWFAPFDGQGALLPLDGAPAPVRARSADAPVFHDGVRVTLTVGHNGKGTDPILLEWLEIQVVEFTKGGDPYYSVRPDGEAIFGAGDMEVRTFFIEIAGPKVLPARRKVDGKDDPVPARSDNAFDTDPPVAVALTSKELPVRLVCVLSALEQGTYKARLRLLYRVAGREIREWLSDPVCIYTDGV